MSSFFGMFNFSKPGPGIDKNAPKKRPFFLFFELCARNFWKICRLSLQYTLFALPFLALNFLFSATILSVLFKEISNNQIHFIVYSSALAIFMTAVFGAGPASAGQSTVLCHFSREIPAFVWGDFADSVTKYLGKSIVIYFINLVALFFVSFNLTFCFAETNSLLPDIVRLTSGILTFIVLIFIFAVHTFIYNVLVNFDVPLKTVYKYTFGLALSHFPAAFTLFVLSAALLFIFIYLTVNVGIFFLLLFPSVLFSLCSFITSFYSTLVIDCATLPKNDKHK